MFGISGLRPRQTPAEEDDGTGCPIHLAGSFLVVSARLQAEATRTIMAHAQQLQTLPLLFSFKQAVAGNGFFAGVRMDGHALLEKELVDGHEESWITGVAPVGIAASGGDRGVAFVEFRKAWIEVVFDIAAKANSFQDFKTSCEEFLASRQDSLTTLWREAVAAVRRERYVDPSLRTGDADKRVTFEVVDLTHVGTDGNEVDNGLQVAA